MALHDAASPARAIFCDLRAAICNFLGFKAGAAVCLIDPLHLSGEDKLLRKTRRKSPRVWMSIREVWEQVWE